jgi:hypothetical protein
MVGARHRRGGDERRGMEGQVSGRGGEPRSSPRRGGLSPLSKVCPDYCCVLPPK